MAEGRALAATAHGRVRATAFYPAFAVERSRIRDGRTHVMYGVGEIAAKGRFTSRVSRWSAPTVTPGSDSPIDRDPYKRRECSAAVLLRIAHLARDVASAVGAYTGGRHKREFNYPMTRIGA